MKKRAGIQGTHRHVVLNALLVAGPLEADGGEPLCGHCCLVRQLKLHKQSLQLQWNGAHGLVSLGLASRRACTRITALAGLCCCCRCLSCLLHLQSEIIRWYSVQSRAQFRRHEHGLQQRVQVTGGASANTQNKRGMKTSPCPQRHGTGAYWLRRPQSLNSPRCLGGMARLCTRKHAAKKVRPKPHWCRIHASPHRGQRAACARTVRCALKFIVILMEQRAQRRKHVFIGHFRLGPEHTERDLRSVPIASEFRPAA